jgi:hypothetical protein
MTNLRVHAIDPDRLAKMHDAGHDDTGNPLTRWPVQGWEPLRCCLRIAQENDVIALVSYSPFDERSPWSETGPVFVHLGECAGYPTPTELPAELRSGPRVLRSYHPDGSLNYEDTVLVPHGEDIEATLRELLDRPAVDKVHVRSHLAQCFGYEVRRR